jgi:phytoene dehydrogenase-like protein
VARVAVVGAGLGGLAAAARLAAFGHAVTVFEQAPTVGGKLRWFARDGHAFDTGPSLVTLPHLLGDLFAATGAPLTGALDLVRLDPAVAYRFADGTRLPVPGEAEAVPAAVDGAQWAGRSGAALLRRAQAMRAVTESPFLGARLRRAATPRPGGSLTRGSEGNLRATCYYPIVATIHRGGISGRPRAGRRNLTAEARF